MSITYVTSFYDIGRKTEQKNINFENYFEWINNLLCLPINLCFFTTKELHDRLTYEPRENLVFIFKDEVPYFEKLEQIGNLWMKYETNNPQKDTPEFSCIMHGKFAWVLEAIEKNYFNSSHYAWIDAGILKVALNPEELLLISPPNKIKCMLINYINKEDVMHPKFVLSCKYKIAGGFFIGPKDLMNNLSNLMKNYFYFYMSNGYVGLEQEYLAIIFVKHRNMFDPYYGDFCDLFRNYYKCVGTRWLVEKNLENAKTCNDKLEISHLENYLQN